ncbi:MAG: DNA cytosine methyltransferase [Hormoscilla sp. SP5CHS1]|nr:DNA cytosine methyltransferase [Hormoscilla sp. SP5CHS1]
MNIVDLQLDYSIFREPETIKYRLIDLFSGAGGMTIGFTDARFGGGFKSILAIDNNRSAIATYKANLDSKNAVLADLEEWLAEKPEIPKADVIVGGIPCQGFSRLNRKREGDRRRTLWQPFMQVVKASQALVFVIENVPDILRSDEFKQITDSAASLGFNIVADVLNSANYGVPQTRKRAVIIGWQSNIRSPKFPPKPTHENNWLTLRDAIGDLPEPEGTNIRPVDPPLDLHFGRNPTDKSIARYQAVPPGGNRFDLLKNAPELSPPCWVNPTYQGTDLFGRLWWDRPSVTIRTEFFKPEKGRYLHPEKHRPITHREAARLMGFPDDFRFMGSKTAIARQLGNAVPPPLAGVIAKTIRSMLDCTGNRRSLIANCHEPSQFKEFTPKVCRSDYLCGTGNFAAGYL